MVVFDVVASEHCFEKVEHRTGSHQMDSVFEANQFPDFPSFNGLVKIYSPIMGKWMIWMVSSAAARMK